MNIKSFYPYFLEDVISNFNYRDDVKPSLFQKTKKFFFLNISSFSQKPQLLPSELSLKMIEQFGLSEKLKSPIFCTTIRSGTVS